MSDEVELTSRQRELETALRKLRPARASIDPTLVVLAVRRRRSRRWQLAAVISTIGVGGLAWMALRSSEKIPVRSPMQLAVEEPLVTHVNGPAVAPPMLLVYRQALAKSPGEVEGLLNRQAVGSSASGGHLINVGMLRLHRDNPESRPGEI